jgi:hypothetical protein
VLDWSMTDPSRLCLIVWSLRLAASLYSTMRNARANVLCPTAGLFTDARVGKRGGADFFAIMCPS